MEAEKSKLERALLRIKHADAATRETLITEITIQNHSLQVQNYSPETLCDENVHTDSDHLPKPKIPKPDYISSDVEELCEIVSSEDTLDTSPFVSADDEGRINFFGATSGLHNSSKTSHTPEYSPQHVRNQLIANAFLQRQKEYELPTRGDFDGVPAELATHLLNLHWNRQHHSFLLTYRPAFTRDLMHGGIYYSRFLLNAIFASASLFSDRIELRDDQCNPQTAGDRFLRRCQELLYLDSLLGQSSIPTVIGLLHLGSAYIARGEMSKSWNYTGLAIRMAFDLGLHLDIRRPGLNAEDVEIRRRAFWAAFITDKLQCLYLGRPLAIQLRDSHVSTELLDTTEELESWSPYVDPQSCNFPVTLTPIPTFTISAFQKFCVLSKLMAGVINRFYFVGATSSDPQSSLEELDHALVSWYNSLPESLMFQPWSPDSSVASKSVTPNIMVLHSAYHSLVILLHRPFVSNGHLRSKSPPENSWKACRAAATHITGIIDKWKEIYALYKAPYLLGYSAYVACTIHVRDVALQQGKRNHAMLMSTLSMLHDMSVLNTALTRSEKLIRDLMRVHNVTEISCKYSRPMVFLSASRDLSANNGANIKRSAITRRPLRRAI